MNKKINYALLGERIKKHRRINEMSQKELAEKIDISISHLSNIETGKTIPSLEVVCQTAKVLEVSIDELVFEFYNYNPNVITSLVTDCTEEELKIIIATISQLKKSLRDY